MAPGRCLLAGIGAPDRLALLLRLPPLWRAAPSSTVAVATRGSSNTGVARHSSSSSSSSSDTTCCSSRFDGAGSSSGLLVARCGLHSSTSPAAGQAFMSARQISSSSSSSSKDSQGVKKRERRRKPYKPEAYKSRVPPDLWKHGAKLKASEDEYDREVFERMRVLLGYYDLPGNEDKPGVHYRPKRVTISNLQTLLHEDFDVKYKQALVRYQTKQLNDTLRNKILPSTRQFLETMKAGRPEGPEAHESAN